MINDDAMQKKKKEYLLVSHSWVLQKKESRNIIIP